MGRTSRKIAKRISKSRQEEKRKGAFLSPFGPPVETRDLLYIPVTTYDETMIIADWQEAAIAYRKWIVHCFEEYEPESVAEAESRVGIDRVPLFCRRCGFPKSDHPEKPEKLIHPMAICLFEATHCDVTRVGLFDPSVPVEQLGLLTPTGEALERMPEDFVDESFVCPRCGFIQPLDPRVDMTAVLRLFSEVEWTHEAVSELMDSLEKVGKGRR